MVGFISLAGMCSRKRRASAPALHPSRGFEGESFTKEMMIVVRAGLERLAPVLMTALTAGIALIPLVLAAANRGRDTLPRGNSDSRRRLSVRQCSISSSTPLCSGYIGIRSAERAVKAAHTQIELNDEVVALEQLSVPL